MKYASSIIGYNEGGPINVGQSPDTTRWSNRFDYVIDGQRVAATTQSRQCVQMLAEFINAVVRDRVPVDDAHCAYLAIDEYRALMTERSTEESEKPHA